MEFASNLWDLLPNRPSTYQDCLYYLGFYLAMKWGYKIMSSIYIAFKTYALPLIWETNFKKQYGEWAGKCYWWNS